MKNDAIYQEFLKAKKKRQEKKSKNKEKAKKPENVIAGDKEENKPKKINTDEKENVQPVEVEEKVNEEQTTKTENVNIDIMYDNPKYKEFKKEFIENEDYKQLLLYLDIQRSKGVEIFSNDFYIYNKMIHKSLKLIILEPTVDDAILGKKEGIFLVKSIYPKEYREFIKKYRSRDANPEAYQEFILDKGVLFPEHEPGEDINKLYTSGEVISLFDVIINMSDLNKRYQVIEV